MNIFKIIRTQVFKTASQAEFAALVGVSQSTVSRWEADTGPSLAEMHKVRNAAHRKGIRWNDKWFFEPKGASQ
jgi:transcriptional regulator with XRE-family HTH domain